jgi:hypothetical protein
MNTDQKKCAILLYTNGSKPFVQNFYSAHKEQSIRLEIDYICISLELWPGSEPAVELQNQRRSTVAYTGILEAILQGLEKPDGDEETFQTHHIWGQASELWQLMTGTDQSDA